jgi:uncharacterized membrane protein
VTVEEVVERKKGWFGRESRESDFVFRSTGENPGVLLPFEADLLEFLFNDVGDGKTFTMTDIRKTARRRSTHFRRWYVGWNKRVKKAAWQEDFFESYAVGPMVANAVVGLVVGGIGLAMSISTDSVAGVPALVAGLLQAILTGLLHRRTPAGQRLYREWKGFQGFLRGYARGAGPLSITSRSWGRYVALAIIFGMHKELIPRLAVDSSETGAYMPMWYAWASGGSGVDGLTASLSGMVASVTTTMSSASGAGGGASAGGGGGAGGGSAGAG